MEASKWHHFLEFQDRGSAEAVATLLEFEEVPARVEASGLSAGLESDFVLLVPEALAERARLVLAQSDFSDEELTYLAIGELPKPT